MESPTLSKPNAIAPSDPNAVVLVKNLSKSFGANQVLTDINVEIAPGEIVALVGRSGSGKSTLLRLLADLDHDYDGEVRVNGSTSVAFQEPRLLPWKSVEKNVGLGLKNTEGKARVLALLNEVGLSGHAFAWPLTLSGGEAQRVSLARALARNPALLLLDEPFGALDALTRIEAQQLTLRLWQQHHFALLLVTHDVEEAVLLADRVLVLEQGQIGHEITVDLIRPRSRTDAQVAHIREHLLKILGVGQESTRSEG